MCSNKDNDNQCNGIVMICFMGNFIYCLEY